MLAVEMVGPTEYHLCAGSDAQLAEGLGKQRFGGAVAGRNSGFQVAYAFSGGTLDQCHQHADPQPLPALAVVDCALQDERGVGGGGWAIAGNEADQFAVIVISGDGGGGEV